HFCNVSTRRGGRKCSRCPFASQASCSAKPAFFTSSTPFRALRDGGLVKRQPPGYAAAMNLASLLLEREAAGKPVTVGLIGAGKFGTMFLAQARLARGLHVVAVADLNVARATSQLAAAGWPAEQYAAASLPDALKNRTTHVTPNTEALLAFPDIEVVVEATGI